MKNIILGVVLTLFVFLSIWLISYFYSGSGTGDASYEITSPYQTSITLKSVATGTVKPRIEIVITSQVSGIVDELFVKGGDIVKKGDPIARLRLVPSPTALNNAKANVELARIRLAEAKRRYAQQKGINTNKYDVQQAETEFNRAKVQEEKYKQLFENGTIAELDYLNYKTALEVAQTALENAKIGASSSIKELASNVDVLSQELESAISNVQLLQKGVASKSGQVANMVRSTVDGMVLDVSVEVGDAVTERNTFNEGTIIAEVANMKDLVFEGNIDESDVGQLKKGMRLELTVGAIEKEKFEAVLDYISPKGVEESGSVKFEIIADLVQREGVFLRAGYSASADIILDKRENVLAILERDLMFEDNGKVYVEEEIAEQEFQKKYIEVGLSDGINIEILKGIDTSTKVKVQGATM
ncbi:efflux RND transporter periplasmic adaptor subunit [Aureispira anguillae]|uniref:HlyD family efflux transporter periplasmic adaptor subunit n=1 Tax=Aureispira anguillae TaxID=2864201 RepID=A0A915YLP7_9BACT|nr:HlyD family efflux transporter periplasmic adaptor subunit [Aureispira anguillae]BDS15524.1 HlyD family efflux transporter periplasmic adaptor subunit [Aureispira anguillae]